MLLVLDTNVVLDWLVFADPAAEPLARGIAAGALQVVTDPECTDELRRVLGYPALRLPVAEQAQVLSRYGTCATVCPDAVEEAPGLPRCSDPDDQKFLDLAWRAGARYLVSRDKALLAMASAMEKFARLRVISLRQMAALLPAGEDDQ
jgi:putative PIN family toxin of toxin-antitoxin system